MGCIPASFEFLETAKNHEKHGSLLVYDEVMTRFRVAKGSAQKIYNIKPDLTLLGKIIGGGLPVGAVGGRSEIMDMLAPEWSCLSSWHAFWKPNIDGCRIATLREQNRMIFMKLYRVTEKLTTGFRVIAKQYNVPLVCNQVCGMFGLFFLTAKV